MFSKCSRKCISSDGYEDFEATLSPKEPKKLESWNGYRDNINPPTTNLKNIGTQNNFFPHNNITNNGISENNNNQLCRTFLTDSLRTEHTSFQNSIKKNTSKQPALYMANYISKQNSANEVQKNSTQQIKINNISSFKSEDNLDSSLII